jgi:murein endopeptidase
MRSPIAVLLLLAVGAVLGAALLAAASELDDDARHARAPTSVEPERDPDARRPKVKREDRPQRREPLHPPIDWRTSVAFGEPGSGSLKRGVELPGEGRNFFTWDPILRRQPNREWRRWGTDDLVRTVLRVLRDFSRDHPGAPRVGIGDLSRPHGGSFGPEFGGIGHATHQNGLDADIYYPLRSGRERAPLAVGEIDAALSQDLVDRFVASGAAVVYVGPNTGLTGPSGVVVPLVNHDNHLHVRIAP